jgi:uncharacterized membrane protein YtjA (UPF0391 family)
MAPVLEQQVLPPGRHHRSANPIPLLPRHQRSIDMLHWAVVFFVIAIIAAVFGFTGIAAGAASIAKILFVVFLILFILSLLFGGLRRGPRI